MSSELVNGAFTSDEPIDSRSMTSSARYQTSPDMVLLGIADKHHPNEPTFTKSRHTAVKWLVALTMALVVMAALGAILFYVIHRNDDGDHEPFVASLETSPPVTLATSVPAEKAATPSASELRRIDCYPENYGGVDVVTEEKCVARGCVYEQSQVANVPWCYVPQSDFGFRLRSQVETVFGTRFFLEPLNEFGIYGVNIKNVSLDVEYRDDHLLRFKFDDATDRTRFKVPVPITISQTRATQPMYVFHVYQTAPFAFRILRQGSTAVLWDTGVGGLVITDQFLQIASQLPSENIYGLGENLHKQFRHDLNYKTWPLWARDQPPNSGDGRINYNLYSVHPFYECLEHDGKAHGVLLWNSNAMDYTFTPLPMITYKTTGGILDFYMFLGPTPEDVVRQYTQAVGRPYMPPYFMLGFQLSRFGYKNTSMIAEAVNRTIQYNIPFDVQYVDIDHMEGQRNFVLDQQHFSDLPDYFATLRRSGYKTIVILDPCIEINNTYDPYTRGVMQDLFVKWPNASVMPPDDYKENNRTDMMGYVWPEWKVVFPDFFLNSTADWWTQQIVNFRRNTIEFDALWLDMNEPANFDTNNWRPWNWPEDDPTNWTLKCPVSQWDDPPYRTMAAYQYDDPGSNRTERLSAKSLCLIGVVQNGSSRLYDLHNLYGWKQTEVSLTSIREAVRQAESRQLRSMVVTRSTYSGSGQHAGRWLGDNASTWTDMALSIIGMLEFNIMGFPYIGADICGFFNNCTADLCRRWHELGAFYPYARNHNHENPLPQDPGFYGPVVADPTRSVMEIRYQLLPYLYTLFHNAHVYGDTVVRPMFHEFASDNNTWDIETQFLWGPALLITPILTENAVELTYYLPPGLWYDYYTQEAQLNSTTGSWVTQEITPDTPIRLHLRGGHIVPLQEHGKHTTESRSKPFFLKVLLDSEGRAAGQLFWDDGDSIDTYETKNYYYSSFAADQNSLSMSNVFNSNTTGIDQLFVTRVEVIGVTARTVSSVTVNGSPHLNYTAYTDTSLHINNLILPMSEGFTIRWS